MEVLPEPDPDCAKCGLCGEDYPFLFLTKTTDNYWLCSVCLKEANRLKKDNPNG